MNNKLTEIVLVVDRSGSMYNCKDEAEGGINSFIDEQKKLDGTANLTIVEFDHTYEFICEGLDIQKAEKYHMVPRGYTALLDATGRAITETGERLAKMDEKDRPGLVAVVVVTDGSENASQEFTLESVRNMIKVQTDDYDWQFTFLGAGPDAFAGGSSMGFSKDAMSVYDTANTKTSYTCASANLGRMRGATMKGTAVLNSFSDEERRAMVK